MARPDVDASLDGCSLVLDIGVSAAAEAADLTEEGSVSPLLARAVVAGLAAGVTDRSALPPPLIPVPVPVPSEGSSNDCCCAPTSPPSALFWALASSDQSPSSLTPTFPNWMTGDRNREDAAVLAGDGAGGGSPPGGELVGTAPAAGGLAGDTAAKAPSPFGVGSTETTASGGAELAQVVPCAVAAAAVGTVATEAGGARFMRSLTEATGAEPVGDAVTCWAGECAPAALELVFSRAVPFSCSDRRSSSAFFDLAAVSLAAFAFAFTAARLCSHTNMAHAFVSRKGKQGRKGGAGVEP